MSGVKVFDKVRGRHLVLTPEEGVRQWFVDYLSRQLGVDEYRIGREVTVDAHNRADIVVYDRAGRAQLIVECKAPTVAIGREVVEQLARYNNLLGGVEYLVATNGSTTVALRLVNGAYESTDELVL
ncbi:hypothetical protein BN938_1566 [Mucinivorans hirudinis]|uniref:Type I restriction enzyme R protein N-terminal domain-containing protein n=1 Tax=Mucinivorans hirudinis TaxID=1433126 RepID=A0A060RCU2_9BACT|nr:hypothetical protein BN938_1566 [Mucinivorans hirudinis]